MTNAAEPCKFGTARQIHRLTLDDETTAAAAGVSDPPSAHLPTKEVTDMAAYLGSSKYGMKATYRRNTASDITTTTTKTYNGINFISETPSSQAGQLETFWFGGMFQPVDGDPYTFTGLNAVVAALDKDTHVLDSVARTTENILIIE